MSHSNILLNGKLFHKDPTRTLEEVQKVNDVEQAQNDVEEFYETPSVADVLQALGEAIAEPLHPERFLYLHATFGSGKTHLLKLIGYATGHSDAPNPDELATFLANRFSGFQALSQKLNESKNAYVPVFLNLLDRDASAEPPVPLLLYKGLLRKLGYPTDPLWLGEFAFQIDAEYGFWSRVREHVPDRDPYSKDFLEACADRGMLRGWLGHAVPPEANETGDPDAVKRYISASKVRERIVEAEDAVRSEDFTAKALAVRIDAAQKMLTRRNNAPTRFLFGLDEVALFIGDERSRYTEFQRTVETLADESVECVVIGTGQWSLASIHKEFGGKPEPDAWYSNEVELKGTDTEIIVRKRWLRKNGKRWDVVKTALKGSSPGVLTDEERAKIDGRNSDPVEAYPFRPRDLQHMREVLQNLMSGGRATQHEYVQGRALLVLVRTLFTTLRWAERELGALVPWSEIFELLSEETVFIPGWVREHLERITMTMGDAAPRTVDVARVIYLLNRMDAVPATHSNIVRFLVDDLGADVEQLTADVDQAIDVLLNDKPYIRAEDPDAANAAENKVYRLLTEDEISLAEKIEYRAAEEINDSRVRAWLQEIVKRDRLLASKKVRSEENFGDERQVPYRVNYSILPMGNTLSSDIADAVAVRVIVSDQIETDRKTWMQQQSAADDVFRETEDVLVAVELSPSFAQRLKRQLATDEVLDSSMQAFTDLRNANLEERRLLENELLSALGNATVYAKDGKAVGTFADAFTNYIELGVVPKKFPNRKSLERGLQIKDDAGKIAAFFGYGTEKNIEWPLTNGDASMLGVDTFNRSLSSAGDERSGWIAEFYDEYEFKTQITGEELINSIQGRGGRWLGTSVEALQALLLTLTGAREIHFPQGGTPMLDPTRIAVAIGAPTNIEKLTIRLKPPVEASELERLQIVYTSLTEAPVAREDPADTVAEIKTWTCEHGVRLMEFRDRLTNTELHPNVRVDELLAVLQPIRKAEPGSSLSREQLVDATVVRQAEYYRDLRPLLVESGDGEEIWKRFLARGKQLEVEHPTHKTIRTFARFRSGEEVPSVEKLEELLARAESIGKARPTGPVGKADPEEPPETTLDEESEVNFIDPVLEQLHELPEGAVVVVEKRR